jgi:serine phosphatase RsbU (regulator of sigma subunit)
MTNTNLAPLPGDRLDLLYRISQTFNSSLDLDEVLNRVMDEVIAAVRAERGFVMLLDDDGTLAFQVARGIEQKTIDDPRFQVSRSIVEQVARGGEPILTVDAQTDARFSMQQSIKILGLRSILCAPLALRGKTLGVVYVDNQAQAGMFSASDLDLLAAIASNAVIAIENARLYRLAVEKGRLEQELQMARQVQASMLPDERPQISGWEFVARWSPARQVAGDYYDFFPCDGDQLGLVVADVADKGMPAALFMALTRSIVRASLGNAPSPVDGITHANRLISADAADGMFVTLFYAQLYPETGVLTYVNAGHNPPLHYRCKANAGQGGLFELDRTGMALGVLDDATYEQRTLKLESGDFLLLYTDGATDAIDEQGGDFGLERVGEVLKENCNLPAQEIVSALEEEIKGFSGSVEPFDDITLMMIKRL